jgi:hypothetical protein
MGWSSSSCLRDGQQPKAAVSADGGRVVSAAEALMTPRLPATGGGHDVAAEVYTLITRALIKLPANGLEWISADRASQAATRTNDTLLLAEAERVKASVCRRGKQHEGAPNLVLAAVAHLDTGNSPHLSTLRSTACSCAPPAGPFPSLQRAESPPLNRPPRLPARQQAVLVARWTTRRSAASPSGSPASTSCTSSLAAPRLARGARNAAAHCRGLSCHTAHSFQHVGWYM